MLLKSSEERTERVPDILQCTRQPPTTKNYLALVLLLRNPAIDKLTFLLKLFQILHLGLGGIKDGSTPQTQPF